MACPYAAQDDAASASSSSSGGAQALTYQSYLQIPKLLSCMAPESAKSGETIHDEVLFITIHQVYELWFRQILFEMDSLREMFSAPRLPEASMLKVVGRLTRIHEILKICVSQIHVLQTMTPMDFNSFREFLATSSGFQSVQFRLFENKLGLRRKDRIRYNQQDYVASLCPEDQSVVEATESEPSLLQLVQAWLERTPGVEGDFWAQLQKNVDKHIVDRRAACQARDTSTPAAEAFNQEELAALDTMEKTFKGLFDPEEHERQLAAGQRRLSYKAMKGAIIISCHRDEPVFHLPFTMLESLVTIDQDLMEWRHNHVALVQRMIGSKAGTGGSSGYQYLRATVSDRYKVFVDLFNLSTYMVPRSLVPQLNLDAGQMAEYK